MRKVIRFLDGVENALVFLLFFLVFLAGLYSLIDTWMVYSHAVDSSILKYKPGYQGSPPDREIQGDMAGWLTMDETGIDYPVMHGDTNEEYLNKDPYGDYSLSGSIFLDSRNSDDFSDEYSLIYGHHMEGGAMFGPLHKYLNRSYFEKHKNGTLTVKEKPSSLCPCPGLLRHVRSAAYLDKEVFVASRRLYADYGSALLFLCGPDSEGKLSRP